MMVLGNILWIALLGILVWTVIRWFTRKAGGFGSARTFAGPSAMEILSQRYARGEIDAATFENMRERLDGSGETAPQQSSEKQSSLR